jgi:hypothetical protein
MIILIPITIWMRHLMGSLAARGSLEGNQNWLRTASRWAVRRFTRKAAPASVGEIPT